MGKQQWDRKKAYLLVGTLQTKQNQTPQNSLLVDKPQRQQTEKRKILSSGISTRMIPPNNTLFGTISQYSTTTVNYVIPSSIYCLLVNVSFEISLILRGGIGCAPILQHVESLFICSVRGPIHALAPHSPPPAFSHFHNQKAFPMPFLSFVIVYPPHSFFFKPINLSRRTCH